MANQERILRAQMALEAWRRGEAHHTPQDGDIRDMLVDILFLLANSDLDPEGTIITSLTQYYEAIHTNGAG